MIKTSITAITASSGSSNLSLTTPFTVGHRNAVLTGGPRRALDLGVLR